MENELGGTGCAAEDVKAAQAGWARLCRRDEGWKHSTGATDDMEEEVVTQFIYTWMSL